MKLATFSKSANDIEPTFRIEHAKRPNAKSICVLHKGPLTPSELATFAIQCNQAGIDAKSFSYVWLDNFFGTDKSGKPVLDRGAVRKLWTNNELMSFLRRHKGLLVLGDIVFKAIKPDNAGVRKERGCHFIHDASGLPALATFEPRDTWTTFKLGHLVPIDVDKLCRIANEGAQTVQRNIVYNPNYYEIIAQLANYLERKPFLACDIETICEGDAISISCIGFAENEREAFVVPFYNADWSVRFQPGHLQMIWKLLAQVLETCPLVGHNAVHFDTKVLASEYGIAANFVHDTMFMQWEAYPELDKSLAFCFSLYTDNEYQKDILKLARSRKIPYDQEYFYNGLDCCNTMQVFHALEKEEINQRPAGVREHYNFNIALSKPFMYMSMRGALLDTAKWKERTEQLEHEYNELEKQVIKAVGYEAFNPRSAPQMKKFFYGIEPTGKTKHEELRSLNMDVRKKPVKLEDGTRDSVVTADYLSTLYLYRKYGYEEVRMIGEMRRRKRRLQALQKFSPRPSDGRMGWDFNLVGTETSRTSGYEPLDGHGVQPQNVDRRDRDLFLPDDGAFWCKADLEGADSWTVAAQLAALGEPRLLEDMQAGIKPAQVLAMAVALQQDIGPSVSVEHLKSLLPKLKTYIKQQVAAGNDNTIYDVCKAINHGAAYMLSAYGMHINIFKRSDGDQYVEPDECQRLSNLLFSRYPYPLLHSRMRSIMHKQDGAVIESAAGTVRHFLGRNDDSKLREMLAHAPQTHTTYTNNLVLLRLWNDPANLNPDHPASAFHLEPLNQVHDEIDFQFWNKELAAELFYKHANVPLRFWGIEFTIPYEPNYGPNWGKAKELL